MDRHIGITVAEQADFAGHFNPAEYQIPVFRKFMDIEPLSDTDVHNQTSLKSNKPETAAMRLFPACHHTAKRCLNLLGGDLRFDAFANASQISFTTTTFDDLVVLLSHNCSFQ